jgi:L-2-hydroxycarboxylate dehydrogenase (NAD+)
MGGRDPFFGTDPLAVALPTGDESPIVIDMAAGSFSVGQVVMAARDRVKLPSPHVVDADGRYTDDPLAIIVDPSDRESEVRGGVVSLGHKGMAWSLIVEILAGLLSGLRPSNQNDFPPSVEHRWREGIFVMAIDVGKLLPVSQFKAGADALVRSLRATRPAQGFERVRVPGELEEANEERRLREGVPVREEDWAGVVAAAECLGVPVHAA